MHWHRWKVRMLVCSRQTMLGCRLSQTKGGLVTGGDAELRKREVPGMRKGDKVNVGQGGDEGSCFNRLVQSSSFIIVDLLWIVKVRHFIG